MSSKWRLIFVVLREWSFKDIFLLYSEKNDKRKYFIQSFCQSFAKAFGVFEQSANIWASRKVLSEGSQA